MDFKVDKFEDYISIKILNRKLDANISGSLKSEIVLLNGKGEKNIIFDLTDCNYCDSSGLSIILVANRLCKNSKGCFVIYGVYDSVEQLISDSQLNTVLTITNSMNNAIKIVRYRSSNTNNN